MSDPDPPVLVFDLDDTLFPEEQFVLSGFAAVDAWLASTHGIAGFGARAIAAHRAGTRGRIFDDVLAELGADAGLVPSMVEVYRAHEPGITLHDDARWALAAFARSHRLALVTDGYLETQRNKVRALGIEPAFARVVYTDAFGRDAWKPSPIAFEDVMRGLGAAGPACTYVADNPRKDFVAPNRLGWRTIQIVRPGGVYASAVAPTPAHAARVRITSLQELPAARSP